MKDAAAKAAPILPIIPATQRTEQEYANRFKIAGEKKKEEEAIVDENQKYLEHSISNLPYGQWGRWSKEVDQDLYDLVNYQAEVGMKYRNKLIPIEEKQQIALKKQKVWEKAKNAEYLVGQMNKLNQIAQTLDKTNMLDNEQYNTNLEEVFNGSIEDVSKRLSSSDLSNIIPTKIDHNKWLTSEKSTYTNLKSVVDVKKGADGRMYDVKSWTYANPEQAKQRAFNKWSANESDVSGKRIKEMYPTFEEYWTKYQEATLPREQISGYYKPKDMNMSFYGSGQKEGLAYTDNLSIDVNFGDQTGTHQIKGSGWYLTGEKTEQININDLTGNGFGASDNESIENIKQAILKGGNLRFMPTSVVMASIGGGKYIPLMTGTIQVTGSSGEIIKDYNLTVLYSAVSDWLSSSKLYPSLKANVNDWIRKNSGTTTPAPKTTTPKTNVSSIFNKK